jgi:hypothetical protein
MAKSRLGAPEPALSSATTDEDVLAGAQGSPLKTQGRRLIAQGSLLKAQGSRLIWQAAGMWLGTRIALIVFTYFAVPFNHQRAHANPSGAMFQPGVLLAHWDRWDTQWYRFIAVHGYATKQSTGFFPLYPALVHVFSTVIGFSHVLGVALIVSNLAALAAFIGVALLASHEYGGRTGLFAVRALAAFPTAFFLAGGYADSLFLALAVFCLLFSRRGQWYPAAACAFLAALDRQFGIILILPMLWEWFQQQRENGSGIRDVLQPGRGAELLALGAAVPLALVAWGLYLNARFGDPLSTLTAQKTYWDHYLVTPWCWLDLVRSAIANTPPWSFPRDRIFFDLAPVVAMILISALSFRRWPVSFALYMLGLIAILVTSAVPLDYDPFNGEGRYVLLAAPLFLLLGRWTARSPTLEMLVIGGGFMLQALFLGFFLRGGWLV